jgi:uncharacterized protein (TIGR02117 family)
MNKLVIFPVIFFFLHTSPKLQIDRTYEMCCGFTKEREKLFYENDSLHTIYLIKQRWHTAVVIERKLIDFEIFPEIKFFQNFELIDIGWGDEEFYQHPGFDSGLAWKALFYGTPSTLRVEGIGISKEEYFEISEIVVELRISDDELNILLNHISNTVWRDENEHPEIISTQFLNRVYFFKANGNYHLFNTCNTWLARGLKQSGVEIKDDIVLTEQLFNEAAKVGRVLKAD